MKKGNPCPVTLRRTACRCGAGAAALFGIAAVTVAAAVYRPQLIRPLVERALAPRGGSATLAGLTLALSPPSMALSGLSIAGPASEGDVLRLERLRVELIPARLFRGGPWLRRVEAGGLVFERPRPRETEGPPDLTPLTRLFDIEHLSVTDARLRLAFPQGELAADGLRLSMVPGEGGIRRFRGDAELTFRRKGSTLAHATLAARGSVTPGPAIEASLELLPARVELAWISGHVSGRTALRVTRTNLQADDLQLTLKAARVGPGPRTPRNLGLIRLEGAAAASLDGREPRLELRGLDIGGLLRARGRLTGRTLDDLSGIIDGKIPRIEQVKALVAPFLPDRVEGMELAGEVPFRLGLAAARKEHVLTLDLFPRDLAFSWQDAGLGCRVGGAVRAAGPWRAWRDGRVALHGRFQGTGRLERRPLAARLVRLDIPVAGEPRALDLPGWELSAGAGEVRYENRPLPLGALRARGSAHASDGSLRVEGVEIRSETLGRLTGDLLFREGRPAGRLNGAGLPAPAWLALAGALTGHDWGGWSPGGAIDVAARIDPAEGGPRLAATVALDRIGFSSPAGDVMGQNLAGRLDLDAQLGPQPRLKADMVASRGEALWGAVYLDLGQAPMDLHTALTRTGPEEYKDLSLDLGLSGFGRLSVAGNARRAAGSWRHQGRLVLSEARLGPLFRTFLRDPLATSQPGLAGLQADGTARMDVSFSGANGAADVEGRLRLQSVDVGREGEPPILSGFDIDLPLAYSLGVPDPRRPRPPATAHWGRLAVKKLRLSDQELGPLEMPAVLVPNRLYLGGDIDASLFGATLRLQRIQVEEPLSPAFRMSLAARLDGLDLARVAGENPWLEGRLGGLLDPVHVGRDRVTAAGHLTGDLFGGSLDVRRVTVDRPFSPGREIGGDVSVALLDMEKLSAALGVGRITGRLSGSLAGLRVAYGQPVAFHLKVESVPTKGVSQLVSLKAVNSISLVSTGSTLSGMGASFMTTFFREFPYARIGVECGLTNDVFTVRGLIREDGVEYLVKRRLLAGINVINRNPDNRIGFSDMLERARRVTAERSR